MFNPTNVSICTHDSHIISMTRDDGDLNLNKSSLKNKSGRLSADANSTDPEKRLLSGRAVVAIAIACAVATLASGYLGWVALTSSKVAGCGGGRLFNCGHVISSRWSLWLGIPVSFLALGLYLSIGVSLLFAVRTRSNNQWRYIAWAVISTLGMAAGMAALWFISLQVFVLNHLCTYCLVAHTCSLIIAGIVLYTRPVGAQTLRALSLLSMLGTVVLIGGQLVTQPPKTYRIETFEAPVEEAEVFEFSAPTDSVDSTDSGATEAPVGDLRATLKTTVAAIIRPTTLLMTQVNSQRNSNNDSDNGVIVADRRMVPINGGTLKLDVTQWPVSGSTSAKYIFAEMFDYSCPHCRHTHAAIKEAAGKLNGDVAVMVLPVPLSTACNDTIQVTGPNFTESCEIAKLAVAVWRTDAAQFYTFHNWMFEGETAPTHAVAKAYADTLLDAKKLDAELASGVPAQYIVQTIELYKRAGGGNVPKLIFPTTTIVGKFTSSKDLLQTIKQQIE